MSTIDIRNPGEATPTRIRFADDHYGYACFVTKTDDGVIFEDSDKDYCNYEIKPQDVANMRKALDKADELGWLK